MSFMTVSITWNGEVYPVKCPDPAIAELVLEAFLGRFPNLRNSRLGLFTVDGMTELEGHEQVLPGADLILRPRVIH